MLDTITATEILADHVVTAPTPTERVQWTVTANEVEFARYELRDALDRWDDTRIISAAQGIAWVIGSARCDGATAIELERMSAADRISMIVDIAATTDCAYDDVDAYVSRWSASLSVLTSEEQDMLLTGFQTRRGRSVYDMVDGASRELSDDDALRMYDEVDMIVNVAGIADCALDEESEHILCDAIDLIVSTYLDRASNSVLMSW